MKLIQISGSYKFLFQFTFFLMILTGSIEKLLRFDIVETNIASPSFGSDHHQFEIQLYRLKTLYERQGYIDCLFVGDSLVWLDLDPITFEQSLKKYNIEELSCFNFGIAALPAYGVSRLTEILIREYNPKLIIFGLHANSVVVPSDNNDSKIIVDNPWVKFKSNDFNFMGWLYEYSYLMRYWKTLNRVLRFDTEALQNDSGASPQQILGFDPKEGQRKDIYIPPDRSDPADQPGFEKYYHYQIYSENIQAVQKVAAAADSDTDIFFVMMPVHKTFFNFFQHGEDDYNEIIEKVKSSLENEEAVLLLGNQLQFLDEEWWDYSHLNYDGAQKFSYWLGSEIGSLLFSNHD